MPARLRPLATTANKIALSPDLTEQADPAADRPVFQSMRFRIRRATADLFFSECCQILTTDHPIFFRVLVTSRSRAVLRAYLGSASVQVVFLNFLHSQL